MDESKVLHQLLRDSALSATRRSHDNAVQRLTKHVYNTDHDLVAIHNPNDFRKFQSEVTDFTRTLQSPHSWYALHSAKRT
jgi:hypothetical protein